MTKGFEKPSNIPANNMPEGKSLGSGQNKAKRHNFHPAMPSGLGASETIPVYQKELSTQTTK